MPALQTDQVLDPLAAFYLNGIDLQGNAKKPPHSTLDNRPIFDLVKAKDGGQLALKYYSIPKYSLHKTGSKFARIKGCASVLNTTSCKLNGSVFAAAR